MPLETELSLALDRIPSVRDRQLVARHLGWDGGQPCSLKKAGERHNLTRERARQVYGMALPALQQCQIMPALDAVLAVVKNRRLDLACAVEQDLRRLGLTKGLISLSGVQRAAQVFGRTTEIQLHRVEGLVLVGGASRLVERVLHGAEKPVVHHGAARVSVLRRAVSPKRGRTVDPGLIRRILQTRSDICWLDDAGEWFWLTAVPRNRLLKRICKVLAVQPRVPVFALYRAILRDQEPLQIRVPVLESLCAQLSWCRVDGRYVQARSIPETDEIFSGAEAIVYQVLRDNGGAMPLWKLQSLCFAEGVMKPNLWRVLSYSPIVCRFDRQVYGLIGTEAAAKKVARIERARVRVEISGPGPLKCMGCPTIVRFSKESSVLPGYFDP